MAVLHPRLQGVDQNAEKGITIGIHDASLDDRERLQAYHDVFAGGADSEANRIRRVGITRLGGNQRVCAGREPGKPESAGGIGQYGGEPDATTLQPHQRLLDVRAVDRVDDRARNPELPLLGCKRAREQENQSL